MATKEEDEKFLLQESPTFNKTFLEERSHSITSETQNVKKTKIHNSGFQQSFDNSTHQLSFDYKDRQETIGSGANEMIKSMTESPTIESEIHKKHKSDQQILASMNVKCAYARSSLIPDQKELNEGKPMYHSKRNTDIRVPM